jgi:hypothetical protein
MGERDLSRPSRQERTFAPLGSGGVARSGDRYLGVRPKRAGDCPIRRDHDLWFHIAEADGNLEDDEQPRLSEDGLCYYICFHEGWEPGMPFWPDSVGFLSLDEARAEAEARVPSAVEWETS